MTHASAIVRWFGRLTLGLAALLLSLVGAIRVGQDIAQRRAERLLADVRVIETKRSTWQDARQLMTRWGASGHYEGSCTARACEYQISVEDWVNEALEQLCKSERTCHIVVPVAELLLRVAHGNAPQFTTRIDVQDGQIVSDRTEERLQVFGAWFDRTENPGYVLIATSSLTTQLEPRSWLFPLKDDHPEYRVIRGNCEGCIAIRMSFTPAISQSTLDRVGGFNLDCFTRWTPCKEFRDILPAGTDEMEREARAIEVNYQKLTDCSYSISRLVKASENIFLLKIGEPKEPQTFAVRELERLKTDQGWPQKPLQVLTVPPEAPFRRSVVKSGDEIIALFPNDDMYPHTCGIIPATPEALRESRAALRE